MANLNGSDMYTAMSTLIDGFNMDTTLFYQLLNSERTKVEMKRPWMRLRKVDFTQSIGPVSSIPLSFPPPTSNRITIPSDFMFLTDDGIITLYDSNGQWEDYTEVPIQAAIPALQESNQFYADHANGYFYMLGLIAKQYTAFIAYQADYGDIASGTTWLNIPARFQLLLPLMVAVRHRMGIDFDDINARNADDNARAAMEIYEAMSAWDNNLQRSSTTRRDYSGSMGAPVHFNKRIDME